MFTLGEGIFSGFFEDDTTKKPVPAPAVVPAVVAETPVTVAVPAVPAKVPEEVLTNEVIPVVVMTEAPLEVVPVEVVAPTDEKVAEQAPEAAAVPEKIEALAVTANEVIPVVEAEILEPAASEIVVAEVPVAVTPAVVAIQETVAPAAVTAPVKATSAEEEGLIEGIVNTFIEDDGTEGELEIVLMIEFSYHD